MSRRILVIFFIISIVSLASVLDLFLHNGNPITFDGRTHMATMAQFATALRTDNFPIQWTNNFATYGLPLPLFAHQLTSYIGAFLILLGSPVVTAYNLTLVGSIILGGIAFYLFIREKVSDSAALTGVIVLTLFPYRIINIYIRGALPEIASMIFFPLLLLGIERVRQAKYAYGFILIALGTGLLALSHPMMFFIFGLFSMLYVLLTPSIFAKKIRIGVSALAVLSGIGLASYYIFPLLLELKYFYLGGQSSEVFSHAPFLGVQNLFDPHWYYYLTHPGPRGDLMKVGLPEIILVVFTVLYVVIQSWRKKCLPLTKDIRTWTVLTVLALLLTLPVSYQLYNNVDLFASIQYPWRFLIVVQFGVAVLAALLSEAFFKKKPLILVIIISLLFSIRVSQLYGKNYAVYDENQFFYTRSNLHSQSLNTIWSGASESYSPRTVQAEIIEGEGTLQVLALNNKSRSYSLSAEQEVRMADYTFYFPGWKVILDDSRELPIEFQDPKYRGLITYHVPAGEHTLNVVYTSTKVRLLAIIGTVLASVFTCVIATLLFLKRKVI